MARTLRLMTWNLWHGLDHSKTWLMWPLEGQDHLAARQRNQAHALKDWLKEGHPTDLHIAAFQEMNPVHERADSFRKELGMEGHESAVNAGIRWGNIGYPFFLQEGLGIFWKGPLARVKQDFLWLTGGVIPLPRVLGRDLSFQFQERRGAMQIRAEWDHHMISVTNLHLHHGRPTRQNVSSRKKELGILCEWLRERDLRQGWHLVCGDFNCDPDSEETVPLRKMGFQQFATEFEPYVTWDPMENGVCHESTLKTTEGPDRDWDLKPHRLDQIWLYTGGSKEIERHLPTITLRRVMHQREPYGFLSDHYGLELSLEIP